MKACDQFFAWCPQPVPKRILLEGCLIVSHRGIHDNLGTPENTLAAFDSVLDSGGIWGIELDFRWTRDLVPVVIHDQDLGRVFGISGMISELSFEELRVRCPQVPTLEEIVLRYGGRLHLMLEAKEELYPDPIAQNRTLSKTLAKLKSGLDFHLLSLDPHMLEQIDCVEPGAKLLVAQMNENLVSRIALEQHYGGIAGHYLLIGQQFIDRHLEAGQRVGTGFVKSKNSFFREINRGICWVFSNHADDLARIKESLE